ncbi:hypothetical protein D9M71_555720 [compost metagenome]
MPATLWRVAGMARSYFPVSTISSTGGTCVVLSMCTGCSSCLLNFSSEASFGSASLAKTGGLSR